MTWSPADVDVGIKASLTQSYPILLSTLLSINRNQLSVIDGYCALSLTSSPLAMYLAICSICDLFGVRTNLYKRVRSPRIIRTLWVLSLPLWIALNFAALITSRAFIGGQVDHSWGFLEVIGIDFVEILTNPFQTIPYAGFGCGPALTLLFLLCLFRRRSRVKADVQAHLERASKPWKWRSLWKILTFMKCAWYIPIIMSTQ